MSETWRSIAGYLYYEVSDLGRVRSLDRAINIHNPAQGITYVRECKEKIRKPRIHDGYHTVTLYRDGVRSMPIGVHRLVAFAFHGAPTEGRDQVAHNNGVRNDNRPANLRWATCAENFSDKLGHGTLIHSDRQHLATVSDDVAALIKLAVSTGKRGATGRLMPSEAARIAAEFGVTKRFIRRLTMSDPCWQHVAPEIDCSRVTISPEVVAAVDAAIAAAPRSGVGKLTKGVPAQIAAVYGVTLRFVHYRAPKGVFRGMSQQEKESIHSFRADGISNNEIARRIGRGGSFVSKYLREIPKTATSQPQSPPLNEGASQ